MDMLTDAGGEAYVIHIIVIYVASEIIIFITTKHYSKHVSVTVKFVLK